MGRYIDQPRQPSGVCDNCGRLAFMAMHAGITCFHCLEGVFMSPDWWHLSLCPMCQGNRFASCGLCLGEGWVATPREDIDMEDLRADWRAVGERNRFRDHPLPLAIAERLRWADLP